MPQRVTDRAFRLLLPGVLLTWVVLLFLYDPEQHEAFLPCPFHWLTGLFCPGCGAQRAVHDLLHGRLLEAFGHNAALVAGLPLLGLQWGAGRWLGCPSGHDNRVVWAWAIGLAVWGIARNLPGLEALAP